MRYCVLRKSDEVLDQNSDTTTLLNFKGEISELLFLPLKIIDWEISKPSP